MRFAVHGFSMFRRKSAFHNDGRQEGRCSTSWGIEEHFPTLILMDLEQEFDLVTGDSSDGRY